MSLLVLQASAEVYAELKVLEARIARLESWSEGGRYRSDEDRVRQQALEEWRQARGPAGAPGGLVPRSSIDDILRDHYGAVVNEHGGPDPDTADSAALSTNPHKE